MLKRSSQHWDPHPTVRSGHELTFGERAADHMRNALGTWTVLLSFGAFLFCWIATNGWGGWDKSPFFRLNLGLSCIAGVQGSIILIAQKRADLIAAEIQQHHLEVTEVHAEMLEDLRELVQALNENKK